ncbi:thioredoxin domain-containing protein [Buttiauxella agrestis]|uniref:DSBA oxidoreductase n=1 Tax=Buttiauxella agrestis ATCC 33320 TaxID=1006004 RepID=A0A085FZ01_9ENTR|nr:thioredoxin domain-containing protein [Buttiauxella agrestis]KFC76696.1 DSBA oxidoreductase [Buttiauxella agrestis ATCC 33320]
MKKIKLLSIVVTSYIALVSAASASAPLFTPAQEAWIGEIAADYLVSHPEILVQVSQKLQTQQRERQQQVFSIKVMDNQNALLTDPDTPVIGPEDAPVAVIEFFDYQCVHCSHMAPDIEEVMKQQSSVRYLFKEWPIFGDRFENSRKAAERGVAIWKAAGPDAYLTYHNGIYDTGNIEGALTLDDISQATRAALGKKPFPESDQMAALARNDELARTLGLTGTPGLIVMPVRQATPKNITVFPGTATAEQLKIAIDKARQ